MGWFGKWYGVGAIASSGSGGTSDYIRRFAAEGSRTDPASGGSFTISFTGSVPPGFRLYNMWADVEVRETNFERPDA